MTTRYWPTSPSETDEPPYPRSYQPQSQPSDNTRERLRALEIEINHGKEHLEMIRQNCHTTDATIHRMCMREITFTDKLTNLALSVERQQVENVRLDLDHRVITLEDFRQLLLLGAKWTGAISIVVWAMLGRVNWRDLAHSLLAWAG